MGKKKVTAKEIVPEDVTGLSFFQCQELIREISRIAEENEGELPDEALQLLVKAHTQSIEKVKSMCGFLKLMEAKIDICKVRKDEINQAQKKAENRIDRLKGFLAEWVEEQGKSFHAGEYELTTRKSSSVDLEPDFDDPLFCSRETKVIVKPDKLAIKKALEGGEKVEGATLIHKINLSIK